MPSSFLTLPSALPFYGAPSVVPSPVNTYTALVGGASVNVIAGSLNVQNAIGQRSQGSLSVWSDLAVFWQYGTQCLVFDETGALVYSGYITKDKAYRDPGARQGVGYLLHDLQLIDNAYRADKRRVFKSYLNTTAGAIIADLVASYLRVEGVTTTASSVATGPTITEVVWAGNKSVADALTWLAEQAGYWWQIDMNGVLWYQPYGGLPAPFTLDGTNADSMQDLSVECGNDLYVNSQYTKGAYSETGTLTETFNGNGVTRSFVLSYPVGTVKTVMLNGVDVTAKSLTKGSSGGSFYYARGDAVLAQDPAQALLTSGDTLVVTYKGRFPILGFAKNQSLITAQKARERTGSGIVEAVYIDSKVRTLGAAFQIAQAILGHYGTDATVLTFSTRSKGLAPGQMLNVTLTDFGLVNQQMLIHSVNITDQNDGINIWYSVSAVGSAPNSPGAAAALEAAQWQTYWQRLMAQNSDPSDFTDANDTGLALLSATTASTTPTVTVTSTPRTGAICGVSMLCGSWTVN